MNYHKLRLHLLLIFGICALGIFSTNICWAVSLPKPLAYWRLDESSQPYRDFSNSNNGACIDANLSLCPEQVEGKFDWAQLFDGVGAGIDVPGDSFNWSATDSFTIAFWMKRPAPPPPDGRINNEVIVGREDKLLGKFLQWWVGVRNSDGAARFNLIDSNDSGIVDEFGLNSKKTITDGQWHHIVAVRDAVQNKNFLYVDGFLEDSVSANYDSDFASTTAKLNIGYLRARIGTAPPENAYFYSGVVDDIRIYTAALSEAQVSYLFGLRPAKNMPWVPSLLLEDQ